MNRPFELGKERKFPKPSDLLAVMQTYFNTTPEEKWTVTGLALLVGSRQLLDDYQKREGYEAIVKEAKLIVENGYEQDLKTHGRSGSIFALKNFGWEDHSSQDIKQQTEITQINVIKPSKCKKK